MSNPVNPSTQKVEQSFLPLSLKPSAPNRFPISYADNIWDVVNEGSLSSLTEALGQFDQHTINELLAYHIVLLQQATDLIWRLIDGQPIEHHDFSDDFSYDFD